MQKKDDASWTYLHPLSVIEGVFASRVGNKQLSGVPHLNSHESKALIPDFS